MELVDGGDLRQYLNQHRQSYSEAQAAAHLKQILSGESVSLSLCLTDCQMNSLINKCDVVFVILLLYLYLFCIVFISLHMYNCNYYNYYNYLYIILGVHYLHSMGVVHRDLKLENILLKRTQDSYDIKIADFGLSALVRIGEDGYHTGRSSRRKLYTGLHEPWGTAEYEAPELLNGAYGPQADIWAVSNIKIRVGRGFC